MAFPDFLQDQAKKVVEPTVGNFQDIQKKIKNDFRPESQFTALQPDQTAAHARSLNIANNNADLGQRTVKGQRYLSNNMRLLDHALGGQGIDPKNSSDLVNAISTVAGPGPDLTENSSAVQAAIAAAINPVQERLQQDILPQITSEAVRQGAFGGARADIEEGKALTDFNRQATDIAGKISFEDLAQRRALGTDIFKTEANLAGTNLENQDAFALQDLDQRRKFIPQMAQIENQRAAQVAQLEEKGFGLSLLPEQTREQIGAARRGEQADLKAEGLRQFNQELELPFAGLSPTLAAISGSPSSDPASPLSGGVGGALGGGLLGASLLGKGGPLNSIVSDALSGTFLDSKIISPGLLGGLGGAGLGGLLGFLG